MPRQKIDYSKTVIYRIHCDDPNILYDYVASTTDITRRKQSHKKIYNDNTQKSHNDDIYQTIRSTGGWDNWKITELEKYPCNSNSEAILRKNYYVDKIQSDRLNSSLVNPTLGFSCNNCDKSFQYRSGLWKHKKTCCINSTPTTSTLINPDIIMNIIYQNSEFKEMLIEQSKQSQQQTSELQKQSQQQTSELQKQSQQQNNEFQKQILELCKNTIITTTNNNNTSINNNSHNKTFNLQFFLNDTCKNAMNLTDFVSSLQIDLTDLESVGELGFVNGLSKLIINGLNDLEECERPVHCSDLKRESMYVKDDDKWEKEDAENTKMKKALKQIAHKNIKMLPVWKTKNPDCKRSDSHLSDKYSHMVIEAMGGSGDNDEEKANKIIRKIAKEVTIKKQF